VPSPSSKTNSQWDDEEDDDDGSSAWRNQLGSGSNEEDAIIELE
jgi:hypothetical protein